MRPGASSSATAGERLIQTRFVSGRVTPFTSTAMTSGCITSPTRIVMFGLFSDSRAIGAASTRMVASAQARCTAARITAEPGCTPASAPVAETVITDGSLELHSTAAPGSDWPVSSETDARSSSAPPTNIVAPGGEIVTMKVSEPVPTLGVTTPVMRDGPARSRRSVTAVSASFRREIPPSIAMLAPKTSCRSSSDGQRSDGRFSSMRITALARKAGQSGRRSRNGAAATVPCAATS